MVNDGYDPDQVNTTVTSHEKSQGGDSPLPKTNHLPNIIVGIIVFELFLSLFGYFVLPNFNLWAWEHRQGVLALIYVTGTMFYFGISYAMGFGVIVVAEHIRKWWHKPKKVPISGSK